jgi:hypothetical protein
MTVTPPSKHSMISSIRPVIRRRKTLSNQSHEEDLNGEEDDEDDDEILLPESQNFTPGTAEDFTEKMRLNGLRWRHEVRKRVKSDPSLKRLLLWVSNRSSSMDEPTCSLGQMLHDIKDLPRSVVK